MNIEIINKPLTLNLHGFSGIAVNKNYVETAFQLNGKMWQVVKSYRIKNKGMNIWIYEDNHKVFTGVELEETPDPAMLEQKTITLTKYAYYKHLGSYKLIKQAGQNMTEEIKKRGLETISPYIEIYGHWINDESKLETELVMALQ